MEKQLQVWVQNEEITCQIQKCRIISNHILGQKWNAAYKDWKYCALNESYKTSFAIYVSLQFLPHIIPIVLLSSVNPNRCIGCLFIFKFFTCAFILFRFTHVITTEITSLLSNLLENILKLKIKRYTLLIYDAKTDTCWTRKGDKNVTS